jgi:CheY-like chemotaxis protein
VRTRVLVVDDNASMCELICEVLHSAEVECSTLTNSSEAATQLAKEKFAAIFLDVCMPRPDGIELTQSIRAGGLNQNTPIVIITGEEDKGVLKRAFAAGASFFLFKPLDRRGILRLMRVTESSIEREARRFQRFKASCKVSLDSGKRQLDGMTLDLSFGGMFVQASDTLPVGTRVQVALETSPGTPRLALDGRVARVLGNDCMGLQLENTRYEQSQKLQDFLLPLMLANAN